MPMSPVSYSRKLFMWLCASAASVVQPCPRGGTYCRSSSQIAHCAGGWAAVRILRAAGGADEEGHGGPLNVSPSSVRIVLIRGAYFQSIARAKVRPPVTWNRPHAGASLEGNQSCGGRGWTCR